MVAYDILLYYLLNISSALYLSAVHNALYFVLDWHTVVLHFWHYCLTFCFLLLCSAIGMQRWSGPLPITPFILPIATQITIILLLNWIHSQIRSGSLYLLRYVITNSQSEKIQFMCEISFGRFLKHYDLYNRADEGFEHSEQNKIVFLLFFKGIISYKLFQYCSFRLFDFLTTLTVSKFSNWLLKCNNNPPISLMVCLIFAKCH